MGNEERRMLSLLISVAAARARVGCDFEFLTSEVAAKRWLGIRFDGRVLRTGGRTAERRRGTDRVAGETLRRRSHSR
jgi:hypothetical protein